jgi:hypothetical protein
MPQTPNKSFLVLFFKKELSFLKARGRFSEEKLRKRLLTVFRRLSS